jgi:type II secretory pathway component PulF
MPPYLPRWLAAGERSGRADKVFSQLRRFFQAEVERKALRLSSLAEPALVAVAGLVVLALVLAFVLPLFTLFGSVL